MEEATIEEVKKLFADFKKANDQRLKEIEDKGKADPLLEGKVNAMNVEISALMEKGKKENEEAHARVDDLELRINAMVAAGGSNGAQDIQIEAHKFFNIVSGKPVLPGDVDVQAYKDYKDAFNAYLRYGDKAISADYRNALTVGSDPGGGYWVNPDTSGKMMTLIYETSPMRQIASVINIGTGAIEGPKDLDEAGSGGWIGETDPRGDTNNPEVGKWRIEVHEQFSQPKATQTLLDDSFFNLESWLTKKVADKLGRIENAAFINGDGAFKPRGFLTYPAGIPAKADWDVIEQFSSGAAGAFAATEPGNILIDMIFSLKSAYRQGANWVMSRRTVAEARKLKDGQGNYMWQPNFGALQGASLLGFSIQEAEDMPELAADSLSIAFGNFKLAYLIVDRQGIRILRDNLTNKPYIKFYTTKRTGGDMQNYEAIKIMKFAA